MVNKEIVHASALFADEMFMAFGLRIEMLSATQGKNLELIFSYKLLEIPIDRSQADIRDNAPDLLIDLISARVGSLIFDRLPNDLKLLAFSPLASCHGSLIRKVLG